MKNKLNANVKFRESFRPFAPLVLAERASEYFELDVESPYMLLAAKVLEPLAIPEVTHVDQTARVQTVTAEQNQTLFNLLSAFEARSGCPVLINTSFNVRGQPIVGSEFDAIDCFLRTQLDALVIGTTLYQKIAPTTGVPDDWEVARKARIDLTHKPSTLFQRIAAAVQTMMFPVRWLMSWLVLSVVYFVFIWPMSIIVRRSSGFDDKVKSIKTYWQPKPSSSGKTQYFKQY
jgi:hypothetical protein